MRFNELATELFGRGIAGIQDQHVRDVHDSLIHLLYTDEKNRVTFATSYDGQHGTWIVLGSEDRDRQHVTYRLDDSRQVRRIDGSMSSKVLDKERAAGLNDVLVGPEEVRDLFI